MVVLCQDGKARRFEPGSFPLAHGVSGRVGLLRGYGNAINPWLAAEFIQAAIEAIHSDEKIIHQPELFT
jgi:DNA (cytosine-5)-methyltransferase 1